MKRVKVIFCLMFTVSIFGCTINNNSTSREEIMLIHKAAWIEGANAAITAIENNNKYDNTQAMEDYKIDSLNFVRNYYR